MSSSCQGSKGWASTSYNVSAAMFRLKVNPAGGAGSGDSSSDEVREPYLRIIEQPQTHYKFRYKTEMESSHGCLYGKSYERNKTAKTYPEVELVNYHGRARITCSLVEADTPKEHPHSLYSNEKYQEFVVEVPEQGSYNVRFPGLCIVHTAVKEVPRWLFRTKDTNGLSEKEINKLHRECAIAAKKINLNILRLKFTAHNSVTNEVICESVFSEHINNLKNAATNILKICRISKYSGRAQGGDDVIILVEKVVKKNIRIRLFEMSEDGVEVWEDYGRFVDSDVHHQYAISFRTPAYRDINIKNRVTVNIELVRPSDGKKSDPKTFCYTPEPQLCAIPNKKRKFCHNFDTPPWTPKNYLDSTGKELKNCSFEQLQLPNAEQQIDTINYETSFTPKDIILVNSDPMFTQLDTFENLPQQRKNNNNHNYLNIIHGESRTSDGSSSAFENPMNEHHPWPPTEPSASGNADGHLNENNQQVAAENAKSNDNNDMDVLKEVSLHDLFNENIMQLLQADSIRQSLLSSDSSGEKTKQSSNPSKKDNVPDLSSARICDEAIVKKMASVLKSFINTIPKIIATDNKRKMMIQTLEELFNLRLYNGDNFLHMALFSKQPLLSYIINCVHQYDMDHLLNTRNDRQQTILHLAIVNNMSDMISFLISKGCDPMLEDLGGNNAIHYTLMHQSCLRPLLDAIKGSKVPYDLDAFNYDKQTALHLSVIYKNASSASQLLKEGANYKVQDNEGRCPLHLAAYDDCPSVARALLAHIQPEDVSTEDSRGYSALQIACNGHLRENTVEMVTLLLEHKADPMKEGRFKSAWYLGKNKPELREVMSNYLQQIDANEDDVTSDEYESIDDARESENSNE